MVPLGLLFRPVAACAQAPGKPPRIGWLSGGQPESPLSTFRYFVEALRELGYVQGQTVHIDALSGGDAARQYRAQASRLVAGGPDLLLASNPNSIEALVGATRTIPIVGVDLESDPVARGWVAGLARPGGNFTGIFLDIPEMSGKQLQFLQEALPKLGRVAVVGDPRINELQFKAIETAARLVALTLHTLPITRAADIPRAVGEAAAQRATALVALTSPLVFRERAHIAEHALKYRLATISPFVPAFAEAGGLLAYGPDFLHIYRRAAGYVDRILKGAKPAELPVQRPEKFELAVNLKTARALGLTLPAALIARADRVIE
jgi:ABC-type uncharacterized transport system substrate-binding protein